MTDQELKDLVAGLAIAQAETAQQMKETDRQIQETAQQMKATDRQLKETDRRLNELGKQIGGLGDKFGSFTEGMALPSMIRILEDKLGLDNIAPRYRVKKDGRTLEMDVFGFSNSDKNVAVVVEVKSHLREEGVDQMLRILHDVPEFLPAHRDKKLYGIIAVVDTSEDLRRRVLKEGLFLAQISGETFELQVPDDFEPRSFQPA